MLDNVVQMLTQGVTFLGGVLIVFGLINLGMTIKDGMQGGGGHLRSAASIVSPSVCRRACVRASSPRASFLSPSVLWADWHASSARSNARRAASPVSISSLPPEHTYAPSRRLPAAGYVRSSPSSMPSSVCV